MFCVVAIVLLCRPSVSSRTRDHVREKPGFKNLACTNATKRLIHCFLFGTLGVTGQWNPTGQSENARAPHWHQLHKE